MPMLHPPLSVIEDRLFDPSPGLIQRWIADDPSLSRDDRQALEEDERARFLRDLTHLPEDLLAEPDAPLVIDDDSPIPPLIDELHQHRAATCERFAAVHAPEPGQMRLFTRALGPEGPLDSDLNAPLAVLLCRRTQTTDLWEGWMMASETDYAGNLDILLESADEPYDGVVAMVQLWNKVECYVHPSQRVIGQLNPERLQTLVSAFADDVLSDVPPAAAEPIPAQPGTLIERVLGSGARVLCGTPLGDAQDPRWRYQTLYATAATLLKDSARLAVTAQTTDLAQDRAPHPGLRTVWDQLVAGLGDLAAELGGALIPVQPVAVMSQAATAGVAEDDLARTYQVADLIQVEWLPHGDAAALKLRLRLLVAQSLVLRLRLDGDLLEQCTLDAGHPEEIFFITPEPGLVLHIQDPQGVEHRWTLAS